MPKWLIYMHMVRLSHLNAPTSRADRDPHFLHKSGNLRFHIDGFDWSLVGFPPP